MSYENFVTNYRRFTHCSRSMGEAYKTAEYCSAITVYKSENQRAFDMAKDIAIVAALGLVLGLLGLWAIQL